MERLRGSFEELGIKRVGVDLDQTTHDTYPVFDRALNDVVEILRRGAGKNIESETSEVNLMMREVINGIRSAYSVHPAIMERAAVMAARYFGLDPNDRRDEEIIEKALIRIQSIYINPDEVPKPFPETKRVLIILRDAIPVPPEGAVEILTHAEEEWSRNKLRNFIGLYSRLKCFQTTRTKAEQMREMFKAGEGVDLIIGDNFWEDIWAVVMEYGRRGVLMNHDNKFAQIIKKMTDAQWGQVYEAIVEGRLKIVDGIGQVPEAIGKMK